MTSPSKIRRRHRRAVVLGYLDNYRVRAEAQRHLAARRKEKLQAQPEKPVIRGGRNSPLTRFIKRIKKLATFSRRRNRR